MTFSRNTASVAMMSFDGLARHRLGREADEVGRVAGTHRHAELAVGLEAADAGP
jgi:hypothetical protein